MLPGITSVIVFGSASFLAVYAMVNYLQARAAPTRTDRALASVAAVLCAGALGVLVVELALDDRVAFVVLVALVGGARGRSGGLRPPPGEAGAGHPLTSASWVTSSPDGSWSMNGAGSSVSTRATRDRVPVP